MRPDKESSPNGVVLWILSVKEVFVYVAKFWTLCTQVTVLKSVMRRC